MSWSVYVTATSPEAAKKYVQELKEPTEAQPYGVPPAVKALVLEAIRLADITTPGVGLVLEAAGHSPNGSCQVKVTPTVVIG